MKQTIKLSSGRTIDVETPDTPGPEEQLYGNIPPVPMPPQPSLAAQILPYIAPPSVPPSLSATSVIKQAGESLLPPGIAFKNGLPVLSMESAKRGYSPVAGQYGLSQTLESAGGQVERAVNPILQNPMTDNPLARANPYANASAMVIPSMAADIASASFKPSSIQQDMAARMGGSVLSKIAVKPALKSGGKILGIEKRAVERAIEKPELAIGEKGINPAALDDITSGLKNTLNRAKQALSDAYEAVKKKLKSAPPTDAKPVIEGINKLKTDLNLKTDPSGSFSAKRGTQSRLDSPDIRKLNRVVKKLDEDISDSGKKLPVETLLNQRRAIDAAASDPSNSKLFNAKLNELRKTVDGELRAYPELKQVDAKAAKLFRAEKYLNRKFGIKAGEGSASELTEQNILKTARTAQGLFSKTGETETKMLRERLKDLKGADLAEKLQDLGAMMEFSKSGNALISPFGLNPNRASRLALRYLIKSQKAPSTAFSVNLQGSASEARKNKGK